MTLVLAIVCPLVAIVFVAVVGVIIWRRRIASPAKPEEEVKPTPCRKNVPVSRAVKIVDFADYYRLMAADSGSKFHEEYENLSSVGSKQSSDASQLPSNKPKNRYTNILPYDRSRVKLLPTDKDGTTDYINANWMPGYRSKREFIACQGPLPGTVEDYWRMIWQYNCQAIVMLANCKEGKRNKCHPYWPNDTEPKFYGDIEVQNIKKIQDQEHEEPEYIITRMNISKDEQVRQIVHFHYVKWPDFGVPDNPESILTFVKTVRSQLQIKAGPTVVHCSAGVGRTGTFIALDRLLQTIDEHDTLDVYAVVHEMRMNRPLMVQTENQYIFLHQCLLHELESRGIIKNS